MSLDISFVYETEVLDKNITHNLRQMADAAGFGVLLWRPDENGIELAGQLIEPLRRGIAAMKADPERFKQYNAENGWGNYDDFLPWLEEVLAAAESHPGARVKVSR